MWKHTRMFRSTRPLTLGVSHAGMAFVTRCAMLSKLHDDASAAGIVTNPVVPSAGIADDASDLLEGSRRLSGLPRDSRRRASSSYRFCVESEPDSESEDVRSRDSDTADLREAVTWLASGVPTDASVSPESKKSKLWGTRKGV